MMAEPAAVDDIVPLLQAIALATRAHQGQWRKDGETPYVSHPFRVAMILRNVFGVADLGVLTAAVLHDTLEDTTTDFDDLAESFGAEIAGWVAALSKDKRLPFAQREEAYRQVLAQSGWQVQVCKAADIVDNLLDMETARKPLDNEKVAKVKSYLDAMRAQLKEPARHAWEIAARRYEEVRTTLARKAAQKD